MFTTNWSRVEENSQPNSFISFFPLFVIMLLSVIGRLAALRISDRFISVGTGGDGGGNDEEKFDAGHWSTF